MLVPVMGHTLHVILMCHAKELVQVATLLRSQNGSDERCLVVGYSLFLSLQKYNLFPLLLLCNYIRFRPCLSTKCKE